MKLKKLIGGLLLSSVLAAGVGISISPQNSNTIKTEAAAAVWNAGDVMYVRVYSGFTDSGAAPYANYPDTNDVWHKEKITTTVSTKGNETLYKYTFSNNAKSFQILRCKSSDGTQWGYTDSTTSKSSNLFEVTGYGEGQYMNSTRPSASVVNVTLTQPASGGTIAVKNANGSQSGAGYYYSDWSLQFTATPTSSEYYFLNWTNAAGVDWEGSDRFNNPVTLTGLSGEFGVSCKFSTYASKTFKVLGSTSGTWTQQSQDIEIPLSYQSGSAATEDGATYYSTSLELTAGSVFKPADLTNNVYYDYDSLESGENSVKGTDIVSDGTANKNMKVVTTATYEIYVKSGSGKVWMQLSSQSEATKYANTFLASITCDASGTTFAKNVWNKVGEATTSMEYKYEHLTEGARNLLKSAQADKDSADPIKQCAARYDRILSKYGYGEGVNDYHDFMGRTPAKSGSGAILINSIVNGSTGSMIAIIAISSVSIAAIGGYFLFKKKKND